MRHLIYRLKYRYGKYLKLKAPVDISLELSSMCNMSCDYCYHSKDSDPPFEKRLMNCDTAYEILYQAWDLKVNSVKFNWRGESTINKDFNRICNMAKSFSNGSTFIDRISNTNFMFKPRPDIFKAFACQTKVKVSLDSFYPNVFEQQRPGGDLQLILSNIDTYYNMYMPHFKQDLVIQAIRTKLNEHEDIERSVKERWPLAKVSIRDVVEGRKEDNIDNLKIKERPGKRQPCLQAFARLIFAANGDCTCCCPDIKQRLYLGNIHDKTMYEMWNSAQMKQLRENLKTGFAFNHEPCKSCSSYESYEGYKAPWNS